MTRFYLGIGLLVFLLLLGFWVTSAMNDLHDPIVKNLEQENYSFHIGMNTAGQVTSFECFPSENGGDRIDENVKIASSTVTGAKGGRFTIAELEAYFKNENYQENSETSPQHDGV